MTLINKTTGETLATITANHSMTIDEALEIVGAVKYPYDPDVDNRDAPTHIMPDGSEAWADDLDVVV